MKKIYNNTTFLLILFNCFLVFSQQSFVVLQVNGNVTFADSGLPLKVGDEISVNAKLECSEESDMAYLSSDDGGIVSFFIKELEQKKEGRWILFFKDNFLPIKEYAATRGQDSGAIYLFFDNDILLFNKKIMVFKIPDSDKSFYSLNYSYDESIFTRKLTVSDSGIIELNKDLFHSNRESDNKQIAKVELSFFDDSNNTNSTMNNLNIQVVQIENLVCQLRLYDAFLKQIGFNKEEVDIRLSNYLNTIYGSSISLENVPY